MVQCKPPIHTMSKAIPTPNRNKYSASNYKTAIATVNESNCNFVEESAEKVIEKDRKWDCLIDLNKGSGGDSRMTFLSEWGTLD